MALVNDSVTRARPERALPEIELRDDDRFAGGFDEPEERGHVTAFLMGGVVVAGGLLAFLYYDVDGLNGPSNRDFMTTGSIGRAADLDRAPSLRLSPPATETQQRR